MYIEKQIVEITKYIAEDGEGFDTLEECKVYEESKLPRFEQIAIDTGIAPWRSNHNELESYTRAIVWQVLGLVNRTDVTNRTKVNLWFGLGI